MNELYEFLNRTTLSPYTKGDTKKITKEIKNIINDVVKIRHYEGKDYNRYTEIEYFKDGEFYRYTHCWG